MLIVFTLNSKALSFESALFKHKKGVQTRVIYLQPGLSPSPQWQQCYNKYSSCSRQHHRRCQYCWYGRPYFCIFLQHIRHVPWNRNSCKGMDMSELVLTHRVGYKTRETRDTCNLSAACSHLEKIKQQNICCLPLPTIGCHLRPWLEVVQIWKLQILS